MELDLKVHLGSCVQLYTHWLRTRNPPSPAIGLIYEGAIAIGQAR